MAVPLLNALFALGVYLGNPNGSDPGAEQAFEQSYTSFVGKVGVKPAYISNYIDNSQVPYNWVGNTQWQAWSNAQSPIARTMIPVISMQMSTTDSSAGTPMSQFQAFAAGTNDAIVNEIVDVWYNYGFTKLVFRLGTEMNIDSLGYAGDDPVSQAAWVQAFQHVADVLHARALYKNMTIQVIWNPDTTNYSNAHATPNSWSAGLYPGDAYVDIIGADMYADMFPYNDTFNPDTYHDWATGGEDTSIAQFVASYVNGEHYWTYPAANINCLDCSAGHSQSMDSLIAFALQHHKPFAVPETGAGNSQNGHDTNDNAAFPMWLAQELTTARAAGLQIAFVTIWDSNGGGNYHFSDPSDGKPQEAAAWATYFGTRPGFTGLTGAPVITGTGPDTLSMLVSEDAWQGDAQFTVSVDGQQVGSTMTASASHSKGKWQPLVFQGSWGTAAHTVSINYVNDANGGTASTDRNLYVSNFAYDGVKQPRRALDLLAGGVQSVAIKAKAVH